MDVYAFFDKYLYDLKQGKRHVAQNSVVVSACKTKWFLCMGRFGNYSLEYVFILWGYIHSRRYDSMKGWVDILGERRGFGGKRPWVNDFHYGDGYLLM